MSGNGVPVLQLDFDDDKIKKLNEIADKFRAALSVGPGGFKVTDTGARSAMGLNPAAQPPAVQPSGRQRDDNGRFVKGGQAPADVTPNTPQAKPGFFGNIFARKYQPQVSEADKFFNNFNKQGKDTQKTFGEINKTLKGTTDSLEGLYKKTVVWSARIAAIGAGGMFGYGFMANRVTEQLTNAQGLGMTTGQTQAVHSTYSKYLPNIDSIAERLSQASQNSADPLYAAMVGMGINPRGGTAENTPKLLSAVAGLLSNYRNNPEMAQPVLKSWGLSDFDPATSRQLLGLYDSGKLDELGGTLRNRSSHLDALLSLGAQQQYQDASSAFEYNGQRIGNAWKSGISGLTPYMTEASGAVTSNIEGFLTGGNFQFIVKEVGEGLKEFSGWLNSPGFKKDMNDFTTKVSEMAKSVGSAIDWIRGYLPDSEASGTDPAGTADPTTAGGWLKKFFTGKYNTSNDLAKAAGETFMGVMGINDIADRFSAGGWYNHNQDGLKKLTSEANNKANLPGGVNVPDRNNNPGNIRPVSGKGFNSYASELHGWGAMNNLLMRYYTGKNSGTPLRTIKDIVNRWAPAKDNNKPNQYAAQVAKWMGVGETEVLDLTKSDTMASLMHAMARKEGFSNWASPLADRAAGVKDVNVNISINQKPGSDIHAQVSGITLAHK